MHVLRFICLSLIVTTWGCSSDGARDADHDAGHDAGKNTSHDGGSDAGAHDGSTAADGGGRDSGVTDSGADAADASHDGGAHDASVADGGVTDGSAGGDDAGECSSVGIGSDAKIVTTPGTVLLVFDRSGSMNTDWNGMPRWQAAGSAMVSALMPEQDRLTIGAVFFPSDDVMLSCTVAPISTPPQLPFQAGALALTQLTTGGASGGPLYQPGIGQTPTLEALKVADATFAAATLTGTTVAILITDGDPNCGWDESMAISLVTAWAANGIKTHVLGVPGVGSTGAATLNAVAVAGGTTQYVAPTDATTLQQSIHDIATSSVSVHLDSCTVTLATAASPASELHMVITSGGSELDVPHMFPGDTSAAWTLEADGKTVQVHGALCTNLESGAYDSLRFELGCVDLPALPKP